MKQLDYILSNEKEVLNFLKSRYTMYHLSNFFFRDVQYGIQAMLYGKNMSVGYADAENIAKAFTAQLEKKKILNPIDQQSWVVNYPEFRKPAVHATPAKPAAKAVAPAAAVPGAAKPSLPPLSRPAAGATKPGGLPPLSRPAAGLATGAKPGGLPPLGRPSAGSATTAKPGGLPPLKSAAPTTPAAPPPAAMPATAERPVSTPPAVDTSKPVAVAPSAVPAPRQVVPGGKKPLPPLRSSTPAGKK